MLKLLSRKSRKDRISFFTRNNGVTAIRQKNGKITLKYTPDNFPDIKATAISLAIFSALSLVKEFILVPLIKNNTIGTVCYFIPAFFCLLLAVMSIIAERKTGGEEFLRNHGAENKVYSAYKKLKRIPTVEEANHFSRINRVCDITVHSSFITTQLIGFIVYINTDFMIPEVVLYLFHYYFKQYFPFNFIGKLAQLFTTSKPTKQNIELAIAALSELERVELLDNMF